MVSAKKRLTPHQRFYLDRLARRAWTSAPDGFHRVEELGGDRVWDRLRSKGYVEMRLEYGPRGGEHRLVRLAPAGSGGVA